ncbi:MAG: Ig-like domain-containing protein [Ruminococcaceae bacterium]|nr:Ig-like domain-containing protein [Oscillospiraceae bacterium]
MKRFLSTLLALALIISLVPAVFAEDTTTETEMEYSGITVKYGMVSGAGYNFNDTAIGEDLTKVTFDDTNGFWKYNSKATNRVFSVQNSYCIYYNALVGDWVAIEIYVPRKGKYDIVLNHGYMKDSSTTAGAAQQAGMWILPLINETTGTEYTDAQIAEALVDKTAQTTSLDFLNDGSSKNSETQVNVGDYEFSESGTYLVVYKGIAGKTDSTNARLYPGTITLDGDGENDVNLIPMTMDTVVVDDKTELQIGETAQMTATAYMSDGSVAPEDYKVTYSSSDKNIATVDENGAITAKAYGTTTITATVDGYPEVASSEKITVTAEGVSIDYQIGDGMLDRLNEGFLTALTYDYSKGFYRYYGHNSKTANPAQSGGNLRLRLSKPGIQLTNTIALAFEIYVPQTGNYTMEMWNQEYTGAGNTEVWVSDAENVELTNGNEKLGRKVAEYSCDRTSATADDYAVRSEPNVMTGIELEKGYHIISFLASDGYGYVGNFTLTNGTGVTLPMPAIVEMDKTTLTLNDTDNTATITGAIACDTNGDVIAQSDDTTTYVSSDTSVVKVEGKTITAVGTGTADITATIGEDDNAVTATRTVTVVDKTATDEVETVQFMATSTLADNAGVTTNIEDYKVGNTTPDITPGKTVKVTASDVEGYIFRGWKRGSRDNGVWVTTSKTYSFPLLTNTYLTAVYDVDTATDAAVNVEFYNFNGQFLASKAVDNETFGTLANGVTPTLTGYNSFFWTVDGESKIAADKVFEKLTRVVAKFTDTDSFAVTVPANVTSNKSSGTYAYDTEIEMSADNAGFWKVNGETVAYGTSYTYCVWSEATITFEEAENDNKPIISIDDKKTDGARMISYDANGANIVEVGILFGANAKINSANSRAVSREAKNNLRGQFTAKPYDSADVDAATAYLIYNDNGTYRVIYAN